MQKMPSSARSDVKRLTNLDGGVVLQRRREIGNLSSIEGQAKTDLNNFSIRNPLNIVQVWKKISTTREKTSLPTDQQKVQRLQLWKKFSWKTEFIACKKLPADQQLALQPLMAHICTFHWSSTEKGKLWYGSSGWRWWNGKEHATYIMELEFKMRIKQLQPASIPRESMMKVRKKIGKNYKKQGTMAIAKRFRLRTTILMFAWIMKELIINYVSFGSGI